MSFTSTMLSNLSMAYKKPFWYDDEGQNVFDADNNLVCSIRGWGHLSSLYSHEYATAIQAELGQLIVNHFNDVIDTCQ